MKQSQHMPEFETTEKAIAYTQEKTREVFRQINDRRPGVYGQREEAYKQYADTIGGYMQAVGIMPEDMFFRPMVEDIAGMEDKHNAEISMAEAFFKGVRDGDIQGDYQVDRGTVQLGEKRVPFTVMRMTTDRGSLVVGGNLDGYSRFTPAKLQGELAFDGKTTFDASSRPQAKS